MSDPAIVVNTADNLFVNESTGALGRITNVDSGYAYLEVLLPDPSTYSIPLSEYDSTWATLWRPATIEDLSALGGDVSGFRPPANAAEVWGVPEETS